MSKRGFLSQLIFLVVSFVLIALFGSSSVLAGAILFEDNFDDGDANGWLVSGSPGWNVQGGTYGIFLNPGLSNTIPDNSLWNFAWTNISYEVDIVGSAGVDKNILIKYIDPSNFIEIHSNGSGIFLEKASQSGGSGILGSSNISLLNNITYHFKFIIENNSKIKVYLDNQLIIDVNETEPLFTNWKVGLRAGTGGVPITDVRFDNVIVKSLDPTPSPSPTPLISLNVPDIKQYSSPWNNDVYDFATKWSDNPTIQRWGCAITSAAMVLQYYGHTSTNPDTLNNWLKTQADGYIRNGLLNWLAVSRYTRLHDSPSSPTLEYHRLAATNSNLITELNAGRPGILEEPNHFVVAKSQFPTTFGINDPAYASYTTLASYGNTFTSLGSYKPSHTDLSYIMLVADQDININLGIPGDVFIQSPLIDDISNTGLSGEPVKIFLFPTPQSGNYPVSINGVPGSYQLDSYLYKPSGEVSQATFKGYLSSNENDQVLLSVRSDNKPNTAVSNITIDTLLQDWEDINNQGLINQSKFYTFIKSALLEIKNLLQAGNTTAAKITLKALLAVLRLARPIVLDPHASQIMQGNIDLFIKTF